MATKKSTAPGEQMRHKVGDTIVFAYFDKQGRIGDKNAPTVITFATRTVESVGPKMARLNDYPPSYRRDAGFPEGKTFDADRVYPQTEIEAIQTLIDNARFHEEKMRTEHADALFRLHLALEVQRTGTVSNKAPPPHIASTSIGVAPKKGGA